MKFLIIGLNFLVENPQAPWKIPSLLVAQPHPPRKEKSASPNLKNAAKFLSLPCRKGRGSLWPPNEGWLFIGRFKVGSVSRIGNFIF